MFADNTLFESQMRDFEEIEKDPNKNVDEQETQDSKTETNEEEVKEDKSDLVDIANTRLGWAVAEQLKKILDKPTAEGIDIAELNPNAIRLIYRFLVDRLNKTEDSEAREAAEAIEDWVEEGYGDPDVLESKTTEEVEEEHAPKDTVSHDPSFERTVEEFAKLEKDPNKNEEEVKEGKAKTEK